MQIADVCTIPLPYRCEQPYMRAAGVQIARNALEDFIALPDRPGLGAELAPGAVERYRTSVS